MSEDPILIWLIDNAIALLALLVAGWSALYTYKHSGKSLVYTGISLDLQKEALELQKKKDREREPVEKKANIVAELKESGGSAPIKIDRLRFTNRGKAEATKVNIFVNDIPLSVHPDLQDGEEFTDGYLKINSGTVAQFQFNKEFNLEKPLKIKIVWDDMAGKENKKAVELE